VKRKAYKSPHKRSKKFPLRRPKRPPGRKEDLRKRLRKSDENKQKKSQTKRKWGGKKKTKKKKEERENQNKKLKNAVGNVTTAIAGEKVNRARKPRNGGRENEKWAGYRSKSKERRHTLSPIRKRLQKLGGDGWARVANSAFRKNNVTSRYCEADNGGREERTHLRNVLGP